jgi:hypothetical protein
MPVEVLWLAVAFVAIMAGMLAAAPGPGQRIDAIVIGPPAGEYPMSTIPFQNQAWRALLAGALIVAGNLVDGPLILRGAVIPAPVLLCRIVPRRLVMALRIGRSGREQRSDRHRGHDHHPGNEHLHFRISMS